MTAKRSESEGSSDGQEEEGSSDVGCGCAATSWLRVAWSQQGCGCNRRKTGQWRARLLRRRTAAIRSERPLLVVFNSLLATIKTVGSEILLRLGCRQIAAKDHCCSKRCGFWSFYQIYDVDAEDGSRSMDLRLGGRRWTSKASVGIAWKMDAIEMTIGQQERGS
ncbi:hypothetical protein GW17_00020403, partial [Ensete ventricosum]